MTRCAARFILSIFVAFLLFSSIARADEEELPPSHVAPVAGVGPTTELGLRSGFQFGSFSGRASDQSPRAVPFLLFDFGYRPSYALYLGIYAGGSDSQSDSGSIAEGRAGANVQWHPLRPGGLDPWLGLGVGYNWVNDWGGLEVMAQLGANVWLGRQVSLGPFVAVARSFLTKNIGRTEPGAPIPTVLDGGLLAYMPGLRLVLDVP
jgi:hypothetical protein